MGNVPERNILVICEKYMLRSGNLRLKMEVFPVAHTRCIGVRGGGGGGGRGHWASQILGKSENKTIETKEY